MKYIFYLTIGLIVAGFVSCERDHLIRDRSYRELVQREFERTRRLAAAREHELFDVFSDHLPEKEKEGLMFLYAFMPLNDLADYNGKFFLDHVKTSLRARKEMAWGSRIPEEVFLHFVLPYRVNNENLDSFRMVYYREIAGRVKGLSMEEAALEINHWCHEKVAYQPADIRTSSPMNTIKNARGRCGEESTFTVAALRTAGIPARQVYVPRWAHSDDNHAWVEVWVDGKWHYLGACEPEPALDMGWFTEPARRAMLVHTRAFGAYFGQEPLIEKAEKYAVINALHRYADTKTLTVKVQSREGSVVPGATVEFQLYNYAEFYPLANLKTDSSGCAALTTGLGDLLIWAYKKDRFGYGKISVSETDTLKITLNGETGREYTVNLDMVPPPEKKPLPVPQQGRAENEKRLKREDSIRLAYTSSFFDSAQAYVWAVNKGYPPERTVPLLVKSMGNHPAIAALMSKAPDSLRQRVLNLLEKVSDKDLRDATILVLKDHLLHGADYAGKLEESRPAIFNRYVLSPRIDNEQLTAYRTYFEKVFSKKQIESFRKDPDKLVQWVNQHINTDDRDNFYDVPVTPPGVYALRYADSHSRKIFFVAACRTFGIPARIEMSRKVAQYLIHGRWEDVFFDGDYVWPGKTASLLLTTGRDELREPLYYIQFTLARFQGGKYHTLAFPYLKKVSDFPKPFNIDPGDYMLVTGNRKGDGSVLSSLSFFPLYTGEKKKVEVALRKNFEKLKSWGKLPEDVMLSPLHDGKETLLSSLLKGKGMILCWINPGQEPSRHILNEIPEVLPGLKKWGGSLVFLIPGETQTGTFSPKDYKELNGYAMFFTDKKARLMHEVRKQYGKTDKPIYPVIVVADGKGNLYDYTEGYRVGIGNHLVKVVHNTGNE
ncbi:MAG: transglutaminase domain-containing protein [Bacteroidales bacterium]|nr:transglutaminase domain-containing protein [Bacteroidales bacterium]